MACACITFVAILCVCIAGLRKVSINVHIAAKIKCESKYCTFLDCSSLQAFLFVLSSFFCGKKINAEKKCVALRQHLAVFLIIFHILKKKYIKKKSNKNKKNSHHISGWWRLMGGQAFNRQTIIEMTGIKSGIENFAISTYKYIIWKNRNIAKLRPVAKTHNIQCSRKDGKFLH